MKDSFLNYVFNNSPVYQISKKLSSIKNIVSNPNPNWQEQYNLEVKIYGEAVLLDENLWYAKHSKFFRILMAEGIITRTRPRSNQYILLRHEALLYFIWQDFFNYEKAEDFFKSFLDRDGKPIDKKRIDTIRKNQGKYQVQHSPSAKLLDILQKTLNHE